jgi:hypothetical protein
MFLFTNPVNVILLRGIKIPIKSPNKKLLGLVFGLGCTILQVRKIVLKFV